VYVKLDSTSGGGIMKKGVHPGRSAKRLIPPRVYLAPGEEREALDSTSGEWSHEKPGEEREALDSTSGCLVPGEEREALDSTSGRGKHKVKKF
jgi:hypothetical protein